MFFCFQGVRNVIFSVFSISAVAEMQFLLFSTLRPWPKADFQCFLTFIHGWKASFVSFSLSSTDDKWFLPFFHFHPRITGIFCLVFIFIHGWRMIFGKSSVSSTDNEHFSAISAFRRPTKGAFHRFSRFVGRRRVFSCIFCISSADDGLSLCNTFNIEA